MTDLHRQSGRALRVQPKSSALYMLEYKHTLQSLREFLVLGEISIFVLRLISQVVFTLPTAFVMLEVLIGALIYCRTHCTVEASLYIALDLTLLYTMGWNVLGELSGMKEIRGFAIYEDFVDWYKYWGYIIEGSFRVASMLIAWRCYQFSRIEAG